MGDGFRPNGEFDVRLREQGHTNYGGGSVEDDDVDNEDVIFKRFGGDIRDEIYKRTDLIIWRSGLETLTQISRSPGHALSLLDQYTLASYSEDEAVRCDVLEYLPPLALFLSDDSSSGEMRSLITSHLMPIVTRSLNDDDSQVVKMADSSFLTLLEHCLVSSDYIEHKIWPVILARKNRCSIESSISAIVLASKMAPWVGRDLSERLIVPFLEKTSKDQLIGVRRVCATLYRDLCSVVSTEVTESKLIPSFLALCNDDKWVVRQTCAEVFMSVSCKVSLEKRKSLLSPAFAKLLNDSEKWVQISAFHSLGPFITTFAEPSITSLGYNDKGELVLKHQGASFEYKLNDARLDEQCWMRTLPVKKLNSIMDSVPYFEVFEDEFLQEENDSYELDKKRINENDSDDLDKRRINENDSNVLDNKRINENDSNILDKDNSNKIESDDLEKYNTWQFWREPIPEIEEDEEMENNEKIKINSQKYHSFEKILDHFGVEKVTKLAMDFFEVPNSEDHPSPDQLPKQKQALTPDIPPSVLTPVESQTIVPRELIDHFVSMCNLCRECEWGDFATHCAYNLPAVALTLGKDNWDLLKPAYETLATDTQWKVRRIVACSIHELAVIVGEDVATQDLVPIFNGFIKDLDEVRIGALKHLAHFLKLLRPAGRNSFLPRLTEFLMTDYDWNWRFRQELAEQLLQVLGLFSPADTCHHLGPVINSLLIDKVASVRKVALALVTELISHVSIDVYRLRSLLAKLAQTFAHSPRWNRRQTFALLCSRLVKERVLSEDMFAQDVLPHLLDLSWDPVANVRLTVARALAQNIMTNPYFADESCPHHEILMSVLKRLKTDKDRDVRYFATYHPPSSETTCQQEEVK